MADRRSLGSLDESVEDQVGPRKGPDSDSSSSSSQSERREEYFTEPHEDTPRKSDRLAIAAIVAATERPRVYEKWLKFGNIPVQTWVVRDDQKGTLHFYRADGLSGEVIEEGHELQEASRNMLIRRKAEAVSVPRSVRRAILTAFNQKFNSSNPFFDRREWGAMLAQDSSEMWVEFQCKNCGAVCKALNRYGKVIDEHERYGRNVCEVMGRECLSGNMLLPGHVKKGKLTGKDAEKAKMFDIMGTRAMVL